MIHFPVDWWRQTGSFTVLHWLLTTDWWPADYLRGGIAAGWLINGVKVIQMLRKPADRHAQRSRVCSSQQRGSLTVFLSFVFFYKAAPPTFRFMFH